MINYIYPPGQIIALNTSELTFNISIEVLNAAEKHNFCQIIEVGRFQDKDSEFVVLDVDIERSQFPVNPIDYKERILIEIKNGGLIPFVYALRGDFPLLPHQNLMEFEFPKCLCLYEQPSEEVLIHWTGFSFLERIRQWLSFSSIGKLHQEDQPLEPFLLNSFGTITLPDNIKNGDILNIVLASKSDYQYNFIVSNEEHAAPKTIEYYTVCFESEPRLHGVINRQPKDLLDLVNLFSKCSVSLVEKLQEIALNSSFYKHSLIIILSIPTKRSEKGEIERTERFVFLCFKTIEEIGIELNVLGRHDSICYPLIGTQLTVENLKNIEIGILKPYVKFDKRLASILSGITNDFSITQIGVGAIGSSIFNMLSRSGFGKCWTLVDDDVLLSHNLYRHSLLIFQVGQFKSSSVSFTANFNLGDHSYSHGITERFYLPLSAELTGKLKDSDLIIDTSASLAVSRILSNMDETKARRISVFLNPKGNDLVFLAEDCERKVKLEELEMLYYKAINDESNLNDHFVDLTNRVRYGNSCRDISNSIPNEYFGIFASIAVNLIKKLGQEKFSFIKLWRIKDNMGVDSYNVPVSAFKIVEVKDWKVIINLSLFDMMKKQRQSALPNETGGILIGSYDMNTKKIYVVDTIFSPQDSKEYPTAYYRGIDGVSEKLSKMEEHTHGFLTYIGEWHSHPDNCSTSQSSDDLKLFTWIIEFLNSRGLPGIMLIVGEKDLGVFVE